MDLKETEARNDCAGEGQQQFNQPADWLKLVMRRLPTSKDMSMLEAVTGQCLVKTEYFMYAV
jgi:hypothetical protein